MGIPEKADARYSNGAGDDTKVTFISGNQKYTTDQEKGKTNQLTWGRGPQYLSESKSSKDLVSISVLCVCATVHVRFIHVSPIAQLLIFLDTCVSLGTV